MSPRLFKKDVDFRYEGAVHNQPKFKQPVLELKSEFVHYGYISDDKELMERKFQRTAINKNSSYIDIYFYLAKAQFKMNKNESAIKSYNNIFRKIEKLQNI